MLYRRVWKDSISPKEHVLGTGQSQQFLHQVLVLVGGDKLGCVWDSGGLGTATGPKPGAVSSILLVGNSPERSWPRNAEHIVDGWGTRIKEQRWLVPRARSLHHDSPWWCWAPVTSLARPPISVCWAYEHQWVCTHTLGKIKYSQMGKARHRTHHSLQVTRKRSGRASRELKTAKPFFFPGLENAFFPGQLKKSNLSYGFK